MGGNIELTMKGFKLESYCRYKVASSNLKGIQIPEKLVPLAIDEFPVLFIAASCADGETSLLEQKSLE